MNKQGGRGHGANQMRLRGQTGLGGEGAMAAIGLVPKASHDGASKHRAQRNLATSLLLRCRQRQYSTVLYYVRYHYLEERKSTEEFLSSR